jgi:hypothetical protein
MNKYLYLENGIHPIIIFAKHKPSIKNMPITGTWIVDEYIGRRWVMPCFPEITWETIKTLQYIGQVK